MPSSTPGGMRILISRRRRSAPVPPQSAHGFSTRVPCPPQAGQVVRIWKKPCVAATSPRPPQVLQETGFVPFAAPDHHIKQVTCKAKQKHGNAIAPSVGAPHRQKK